MDIALRAWIALVCISLFGAASFAAVGPDSKVIENCEWFNNEYKTAYCITRVEGSENQDILFYMHGASGSEKNFMKARKPIMDAWLKAGKHPPTIVTVSYGPVWLMNDKNGRFSSGLYPFITEKVFPALESKLGGLRGERIVVGESMGSFNISQMIMRNPGMFARAAMLCPAIQTVSPWASRKEVKQFIAETGADREHVFWDIVLRRSFFTEEAWSEWNPLAAGQTMLGPQTPPIYISCGRQDEWGFFKGSEEFANLAIEKGVSVTWEPQDGKHCAHNPEAVANFLVP